MARLLVAGAGIRRRVWTDGEEFSFRRYASAGALYPIEIYVVCSELSGLPVGVYHFDPRGPTLERLREGDQRRHLVRATGEEPTVAEAPVTMVLSGIPWRTTATDRSARVFGRGSMPLGVLAAVLEAATGSIPTDLAAHSLTDVYLVANAVDGLDSGAYVHRRGWFNLLGRGDFRRKAAHVCLDQRLGGDAAVTHFLMTNLEEVLGTWDERGYRAAQLEAGIVAGKIYLGAYGYGYGATGLTFYDDEVTSFFSPHAADKGCVLVVGVGESIGRADLRPIGLQKPRPSGGPETPDPLGW